MNRFFLIFMIHLFLSTLIGWVILIGVIVAGIFSGIGVIMSFAIGAVLAALPSYIIVKKLK